jgi:hypothetical protein
VIEEIGIEASAAERFVVVVEILNCAVVEIIAAPQQLLEPTLMQQLL